MSGVGEVGIVVKAMKLGAFDYIEKPLHRQILIDRIGEALNDDALKKISHARDFEVRERMSLLSDREREVCKLLVDGKSSKEVSNTLQICVPTVTKHRISIFEKLGVENIVELVRLVAAAENSSRNTIHA